jgi:hypothetical protein
MFPSQSKVVRSAFDAQGNNSILKLAGDLHAQQEIKRKTKIGCHFTTKWMR